MSILTLRDLDRKRALDLKELRRMVMALVRDELAANDFDLGIYVVGAGEMTRLNEVYLGHQGATDVITFDYATPPGARRKRPNTRPAPRLHGEIFVCLDEAVRQAKKFRVSWQKELVRYIVHGVLHLCGHDDLRARDRLRMKLEEGRLLHRLTARRAGAGMSRRRKI